MTWTMLAQSWPSSEELTANIGLIALKVLAVAGAALIGALVCGFGGAGLARLLYAGKLPKPVISILRYAGGIVSACLVGLLLFWSSGSGTGGGTGGGNGEGTGSGSGGTAGQTSPVSTSPTTGPDKTTPGAVVQVKVHRGGGKDNPIYEIDVDGKPEMFKLSDLLGQIRLKKDAPPGVGKVEIVLRYKESPDVDTDQVISLQREMTNMKLDSSVQVTGKPDKKDR